MHFLKKAGAWALMAAVATSVGSAGCSGAQYSGGDNDYDRAPHAAPSPQAFGGIAVTESGDDREERYAPKDEGGGDAPEMPPMATGAPLAKRAPEPVSPSTPQNPATPKPTEGQTGAGNGNVGADHKAPILIYKADFTLAVYEVQKSVDAVQALAEKAGGYLSKRDDTSITVRVPAGSFQGVVTDLGKLGDVLNRNVTSEDVTAEYRDLEVQLTNALAMRDRFAKLLEKAQKVDEALEIEKELGRVTNEIERIKGRLKLLADLAQYSTITVRFSAHASQQVQQGPFVLPLPWLDNLGLPRLLQL